MSNTLYIATSDTPVTLSWEGAEPRDPGPGGTLVRMMIAQMAGHQAAVRDEVTDDSWDAVKVGPPGKFVRLRCGRVAYETPETAVVPTWVWCDGSEQALAFVVRRGRQRGGAAQGGWKVDMATTIDRAMGGILDEAAAAAVAG